MNAKAAGAISLAGAGATLLASLGLREAPLEAVKLAAIAGGAACGVGIAGAAVLYLARRRSIVAQSALVALIPIGAVAAGAMAASHLMMEASRPVAALGVVLISAGTVGILTSLGLGGRLRAGSERLIAATRQIGRGNLKTPVDEPPAEELAALARELDAMQSQLEQSRARQHDVEQARRELVAWISHDLRTPLGRVKAIVEALEDDIVSGPAEVADYYARLRAETDRLGGLVNDLFELNRISAGALELELDLVDLGDVVSDVVASFAVIADARGIALTVRPAPSESNVEMSPAHFERALGNLLDNALRYTEEGGLVEVAVVANGGEVFVEIDDSCGGVAVEELKPMLTTPRGPQLLGRSGRTGLGLAIAKGLVEIQGGSIDVERTARGCRFIVALPLASVTRVPPRAAHSIDGNAL